MNRKGIFGLVLVAGITIALAFVGGCVSTTPEQQQGTDIIPLVVFLVLIFAMMYFLMVRPQRKRQKEHQNLMSQLRKGDKVITAGGIYGEIESTSEDSVVIKVESGTTLRVARNSIAYKRQK